MRRKYSDDSTAACTRRLPPAAPTVPSEEEIHRRAADIRRSWSERDYRKRAGQGSGRWHVPLLKVPPIRSVPN